MKRSTPCLLALLTLSTLHSAAAAQPLTPGPEILVDDQVASDLGLAAGASGGLLVSWGTGGPSASLHQRAYSPTEQPADARLLDSRWGYSVTAGLSTGGYVAVWNHQETQAATPRLVAQFLDATGLSVGNVLELGPRTTDLAIAARPAGGFMLAWKIQNRIVARQFNGAGAPDGEEIAVTPTGELPAMAVLSHGGFVVAWAETNLQGRQNLFRVFGPDGAPVGDEVVAGSLGSMWVGPKVTADAAGRFVLAWSETLDFSGRRRVRAQRFSAGGEALGPVLIVAEAPAADWSYSLLDVAARPDGSFLVLFDRREVPGAFTDDVPQDPMVRAYDATGAPLGDMLRVSALPSLFLTGGAAEASAEGWTVSWSLTSFIDRDYVDGIFLRSFSLGCGGTASALCLGGGRFRVEVAWKTPAGAAGAGSPIPLTDDTGAFWFFSPSNYELNVKILDGRASNGRFWVFYGSLTDVEFDLTVTDTATGQVRTYHNPPGHMASRADTSAF